MADPPTDYTRIMENINSCQMELPPLFPEDILDLIIVAHHLDQETGLPFELGNFVCQKVRGENGAKKKDSF